MSSSTSSSYSASQTIDHAGGQNAAHQKSSQIDELEAQKFAQLMSDPVAAITSANRIRRLQDYLAAYRGGYQLPDQEVIPPTRLSQTSLSSSTSSSHSSK